MDKENDTLLAGTSFIDGNSTTKSLTPLKHEFTALYDIVPISWMCGPPMSCFKRSTHLNLPLQVKAPRAKKMPEYSTVKTQGITTTYGRLAHFHALCL